MLRQTYAHALQRVCPEFAVSAGERGSVLKLKKLRLEIRSVVNCDEKSSPPRRDKTCLDGQ